MSRRRRLAVIALSLVAVAGMLTSDASAHGRYKHRSNSHRHGHPERVVVVRRPVVVYPQASFTYYRPAPAWCGDTSYMMVNGDPYWYHVGLGVFFGGVNVNVNVGNAPPSGFGYWDPYCDEWFDSAAAYSQHCGYCDHERVLQVVAVDHCSGPRW